MDRIGERTALVAAGVFVAVLAKEPVTAGVNFLSSKLKSNPIIQIVDARPTPALIPTREPRPVVTPRPTATPKPNQAPPERKGVNFTRVEKDYGVEASILSGLLVPVTQVLRPDLITQIYTEASDFDLLYVRGVSVYLNRKPKLEVRLNGELEKPQPNTPRAQVDQLILRLSQTTKREEGDVFIRKIKTAGLDKDEINIALFLNERDQLGLSNPDQRPQSADPIETAKKAFIHLPKESLWKSVYGSDGGLRRKVVDFEKNGKQYHYDISTKRQIVANVKPAN